MMRCLVLCLLGLVATANSQVTVPSPCQDVTLEQDFDVTRYLGLWYENQRYPLIFEAFGICNTATYSDNNNGTVGVYNYMYNKRTERETDITGYAVLNSESDEGKLLVSFPSSNAYDADYWILDTDYDSYSVVWSCSEAPFNTSFQSAWVLTRERFPSASTLAAAEAVLAANNVSTEELKPTDQSLCPGDPEFSTPAP